MKTNSLNLFIEINNLEFVFVVVERMMIIIQKLFLNKKFQLKVLKKIKLLIIT